MQELIIFKKTIEQTKSRISISESKIANLEKTKPSLQDKVIEKLAEAVSRLEKFPSIKKLESEVKTIQTEHPKRWGITVKEAETRQAQTTTSTDRSTREYVDRKLAQVTEAQFSSTEWVGRYGKKNSRFSRERS